MQSTLIDRWSSGIVEIFRFLTIFQNLFKLRGSLDLVRNEGETEIPFYDWNGFRPPIDESSLQID